MSPKTPKRVFNDPKHAHVDMRLFHLFSNHASCSFQQNEEGPRERRVRVGAALNTGPRNPTTRFLSPRSAWARRAAMLRYAWLCSGILGYARLCWVMVGDARLRSAMLGYVPLRSTMLRYALICSAMLDYARRCSAILGYVVTSGPCDNGLVTTVLWQRPRGNGFVTAAL